MPEFTIKGAGLVDEIFSYREVGSDTTLHFNATQLRRAIDNRQVPFRRQVVALEPGIVNSISKHGGIEEWKVARLAGRPDLYLKPVIVLAWDSGQHTLLDGNHRLILCHRYGRPDIRAYFVSLETAMLFSVEMPAEITDYALGIKSNGKGTLR